MKRTWEALDDAERVGQLFNLRSVGFDTEEIARVRGLAPGGITRFFDGSGAEEERARIAELQQTAKVPMLVSADLEGSRMSLPFGTQVPNPLALAAIDDVAATEEVARIMAREARAVGVNWSFTPVLDINAAWRSSIVATRSYGSDVDRIARHALPQIRVFQEEGIAATAKHWPGEGHDDRDQHLVTTINPLTLEEWDESHGRLYREAIDAGVMSVMTAHIAFPDYARRIGKGEGADAFLPGSVSEALNTDLLRERLGFNGIVVSDASRMAGLSAVLPQHESKVQIIATGGDMILFSLDPVGEMEAVLAAVREGRITPERFFDAVTRVLGLKAWLGLHRGDPLPAFPDPAPNKARMEALLRRAPVLEKDIHGDLPLDPEKHRRVLMFTTDIADPMLKRRHKLALPNLLRAEGFEVTVHEPGDKIEAKGFDVAIYALAEETLLTRGRIFLDWAAIGGGLDATMRRLWHEIPVVMVSFGFPYYLYDAPRVPTYINAFATMEPMQEAVVDLLMGRATFEGTAPVDAFVSPDAHY
ncbi:beta-N-acetylhexosaminidase [Allosediminivita pacifica]|uniref:beta-N-acetylhexosaminidase n=2 Tax=Allosediminivita pacifica TaxID=1267769 RepID=A0A2T6B1B5_9RHOB|nr:beta-N-acetylhexosaminidase [Allosediminivita pacifica]